MSEDQDTAVEQADALANVLHKAGEQFAFYAREHRAKGTPEAEAKAGTNEAWAARCFAACAAWEDWEAPGSRSPSAKRV